MQPGCSRRARPSTLLSHHVRPDSPVCWQRQYAGWPWQGRPWVLGIGLTLRFSAVFNHPDAVASATLAQVQVSTDGTFATITHWDSAPQSISTTSAGTRCTDVSYGGSALAVEQTYWWRIRFGYSAGAWTEWSSERASFVTTGLLVVTAASFLLQHICIRQARAATPCRTST